MTAPIAIDTLPAPHVVEAAIAAFADELEIDNPADAAARLSALTGGRLDVATANELVARAGAEAQDDVVRVLRDVMSDRAENDPDGPVPSAVRSAGATQFVVTPDDIYMATVVVAGLFALNPPKSGETVDTTIEEQPDGRRIVRIVRKITYLNPSSALVKLLEAVLRSMGGGA